MGNFRKNKYEYDSYIYIESVFKENGISELTSQDLDHNCFDSFGVSLWDIKSTSRLRDLVIPRQIFHYLLSRFCSKNKSDIGNYYNRNHSTVIYSIYAVEDLYGFDRLYTKHFKSIINKLVDNLK